MSSLKKVPDSIDDILLFIVFQSPFVKTRNDRELYISCAIVKECSSLED